MPEKDRIKKEFDSYKKLSVAERIQLVEDIWDSIESDNPESFYLSDVQKAELHHRIKAHQDNPSSGIPWETVRKKLFQTPS